MPATAPRRPASARDVFAWSSLGVLAAACVLWLAYARTDAVAAAVFGIRPGQPYRDVLQPVRVYLAIRGGGVLLAWGLLVGCLLLRRQSLDGHSPAAWLHLGTTLGTLLLVMVIVRDLVGRRFEGGMWIGFAGIAAAAIADFLRARRRSPDAAGGSTT